MTRRNGPLSDGADEPVLALRPEAVAWQGEDGETIALDLAHSSYVGVNATGTVLWELLAAGTTRTALIRQLCDRYGVAASRAADDVDRFVQVCSARGYLRS